MKLDSLSSPLWFPIVELGNEEVWIVWNDICDFDFFINNDLNKTCN